KTKCICSAPNAGQKDFITIAASYGCFNSVGRKGGEQILSLGSGCDRFEVVVHELIHALGFDHDHTRSYRDSCMFFLKKKSKTKFRSQYKIKRPDEHR
ncbi:zinc metalloproteinase nas-6-like, partial [Varroa jacobsoni]|uniref:zinc metalloproteinase nas-6-like n=1 Tax=Varroa jacobsoni TaxID=62625 RepID=UPI000BF4B4C8